MITLKINTQNLEKTFEKLAQTLSGNLEVTNRDYDLSFNSYLGKGSIKAYTLPDAIVYLEYDVSFKEDTVITKVQEANTVQFTYSLKGVIDYRDDASSGRKIKEFSTNIFSSHQTAQNEYYFSKDTKYKISVICVDTALKGLAANSINKKIADIFQPKSKSGKFLHIGSLNLKISDQIERLDAVSEKGVVKSLLTRGMVQIILAMEIQQHQQDMVSKENQYGSLSMWEIKAIKELANSITKNPEEQYTITSLCRRVGMSPAKLQKGFKLLKNLTVNDYIRNERLNLAEKLIVQKKLTISEVVYSVGLTSRSYFSKIFKTRFKCSPKYYQENFSNYSETV